MESLKFEWGYLQLVVSNCSDAFATLCNTINKKFWRTVFGRSISEQEKTLFFLPTCKGRLGICDRVESAQHFNPASVEGTTKLVSSIKGEEAFSVLEHRAVVINTQAKMRKHQMGYGARPKEARGNPRADGHQKQTCSQESSGWKDIWLAQRTAHSTPPV